MFKMSITNKDSLRDYIHCIHDFLRNHGAGYGMNALKIFNVFYGLLIIEENEKLFKKLFVPVKKIESQINENKIRVIFKFSELDQIHFEKFKKLFLKNSEIEKDEDYEILLNGFQKVFRFTTLLKYSDYKGSNDEDLYELINQPVLDFLSQGILRSFLFYEIPKLRNETYAKLIKMIAVLKKNNINNNELQIDDTNFQLAGKIYEYFVGRDESAISELGAYFTDRYITRYIYNNLLNPELNENGECKTAIDPFGGSGGFSLGYIEYLKENYENIEWSKNFNKIYHFDMNEDVVKSASLEMMCLTGETPDTSHFRQDNSFTAEFENKVFDYVITNPPYGGDKVKKTEQHKKREILQKYINDSFKNINLSLEHKTKRLEQLNKMKHDENEEKKEFDKNKVTLINSSIRIREFSKKYNLNPNDKESSSFILIMDLLALNGTAIGVLKEGVFFDKKYSNIRKVLIENYNVTKIISIDSKAFENTSTKTSIVVFHNTEEKTNNIDFYNLVIEKEKDNIFEELDDGTIILSKSKGDIVSVSDVKVASANINKIKNKNYSLNYKLYEKSNIKPNQGYHFEKIEDLINSKKIIYGSKSTFKASDGKENGQYNFYTSSNEVKKCDFISYEDEYLLIGTGGNSCLHYDKNFSCSGDMLLLKSEYKKFLYFIFNMSWDNFTYQMNGTTIKHVTKELLNGYSIPIPNDPLKIEEWSNKIGLHFDLINSSKKEIEDIEKNIMNDINRICNYENIDEIYIKNISDINRKNIKKYNTSYGTNNGKYFFFTGSLNNVLYCNECNIFEYAIVINKTNGSGKCNIIMDKNISVAKQTFILTEKNNFNIKYIYYYLLLNKNILQNGYIGACHKNLSLEHLENFTIKYPKNTQLIDDLKPQFDRLEELHLIYKEAKMKFDELTIELKNEAIIECENDLQEDEESSTESNNLQNINDSNDDDSSVISKNTTTSSTSNKSSKNAESLEEFEYQPIKSTVETFNEIKTRLNNGKDTKIKCPCNNDIIFMTKIWDEHRKTDIHKDYVKSLFPTEKKTKKTSK